MKLSLFLLCSITGTVSSTVLINDDFGQLYTMPALNSGIATPFLSKVNITSVTRDTLTGKIFLTGPEGVKEVCGGAIKDVAQLPSGVILDCLTGGPHGVYALNKKDSSYGVLSDCGTYTKIGQLPVPYEVDDGYVFTQDDKGQLHVIDAKGNHYIQIAQCGWVKQAMTFTPKHENYCGYFKPDASGGTIYAGSSHATGKIATYNLANGHEGTLDITGVSTYIYDVAVDVDTNRACTTCTPTAPTVPTPMAPTICSPTAPTSPTLPTPTAPTPTLPTPTAPTKPTPTTPTSKGTKKGKKAPSPTSKGGKKTYGSNGSIMTGFMNTTEFNATLGYFN